MMPIAPPNIVPVTEACLIKAAETEHVPIAAIVGILRVEGGRVGRMHRNDDGSYDLGPMQINTRWLPFLQAAGIDPYRVLYDGCLNLRVGARILHQLLTREHDPWHAIGAYHSRTPALQALYATRVARAMNAREPVARTIARANEDSDVAQH